MHKVFKHFIPNFTVPVMKQFSGLLITQYVWQTYYVLHHLQSQSGPRVYKGKRVKVDTQWAYVYPKKHTKIVR